MHQETTNIGPSDGDDSVTNVGSGTLDAEPHADIEFRVGAGVYYDSSGIGVNRNNACFQGGPLFDFALGLLALAQCDFEFSDFNFYRLAGLRIRSNRGAEVVLDKWQKIANGGLKIHKTFAGDLIILSLIHI